MTADDHADRIPGSDAEPMFQAVTPPTPDDGPDGGEPPFRVILAIPHAQLPGRH